MPLVRSGRLWAAALLFASPAAADAAYIYWSDGGFASPGRNVTHIKRSNLDGTGVQTILTTGGGNIFGGIAFDAANGHFYSGDRNNIFRANLDGTGRVDLTSSLGLTADVELDLVGGKIYWSSAQSIHRANLDGSGVETFVGIPGGGIEGLALDLAGGRLFWASSSPNDQVGVVNLDGTGAAVFHSSPDGSDPFDVEVDAAGGQVYWSQYSPGSVADRLLQRAKLDGTGPVETVVAAGANELLTNGIHFDPVGRKVYYALSTQNPVNGALGLYRVSPDGTGRELVLTDPDNFNYVEVLNVTPAAVPEPGSVVLAGVGAAGLAVARRRRRTPA